MMMEPKNAEPRSVRAESYPCSSVLVGSFGRMAKIAGARPERQ